MKVLHIGKYYAPIEGGIESINRFVVEALKKYPQRVLSFNNKNNSCEEDIDGVSIVRASSTGILASQPISIKYFWELRRYIRLFDPDVIHFHYPNPLGALYLNLLIGYKRKLIVHWHSDIVAQKNLYRLIKPIEKKILEKATVIIATSPDYKKHSYALRNFQEKVTTIPCSIDENKLELKSGDEEKIKNLKMKYDNKPILLFVGRHVEYKGIRYLLESEKYVKNDCVFLIGGKGPLTDELMNQFSSSRIHWLGRINDEELRIYYHAASLFTFPSITKNEAFGVVLAEAMYCKTPTITFTIEGSGVNWVSINEHTGLEVENKNTQEYAKAIDRLLMDQKFSNSLGQQAKERVKQLFTKEAVSTKYQSLYESFDTTHKD